MKLALQREEKEGRSWEFRLCQWLFRYRTTPHSVTSVTSAELISGRKLKTRLDLLYPDLNSTVLSKQIQQRQNFDRTAVARPFAIGDLIFARNYSHGSQWLPGFVIAVDGSVSYVVRLCDGRTWRRHGDQLRARTETQQQPYTHPTPTPRPVSAESLPRFSAEDRPGAGAAAPDSGALRQSAGLTPSVPPSSPPSSPAASPSTAQAGHRVIIPTAARNEVLRELHVGHPGIVKTKALARSIAWWPGIDDDITQATWQGLNLYLNAIKNQNCNSKMKQCLNVVSMSMLKRII